MISARLELLGKCTLFVEGKDRSRMLSRTSKGTGLLTLLCLSADTACESLYLQERLWPDSTNFSNRSTNYRKQLSRIREAFHPFEEAVIVTDSQGIRLDKSYLHCDLLIFLDCLAKNDLEGAVAAYAGPLLPGNGDAWAEEEREKLRVRFLDAIATLVEQQPPAVALETIDRWRREAPESQEPLRQRWRCLVQLNRQAQALAEANAYCDQNPDAEPETRSWQERLQKARPPRNMPPLPVPWTPFIGRELELGILVGGVRGARLFTLCGEGGMGKTRLALELARRLHDTFEQQIAFIDLSGLPAGAGETSVRALLERTLGESLEAIAELRALLILDNAEHVLPAVGKIVHKLLAGGDLLQLLVTSRQELGYRHERKQRIQGLELPDARNLFLQVSPLIERLSNPRENAALDTLCKRLDNWPLVIELTASRREAFDSLHSLEQNLEQALLEAEAAPDDPTISYRERTLNTTLDWSARLLEEQTRRIWEACPSFVGGISSQALAGVTGLPVKTIQAALEHLAVVSLVRKEEGERYRLLEPVRAYLKPKETVQEAFAAYFLQLAESQPGDMVFSLERANIAAAGKWLLENAAADALRLGAALWRFWWLHGSQTLGFSFLQRVLEQVKEHPLRIECLIGAGALAYELRLPEAEEINKTAQEQAHAIGDVMLEARAWLNLGLAADSQKSLSLSDSRFKQAEVLFASAGSERGVRLARANQAMVAADAGYPEQALVMHRTFMKEFDAIGDDEAWLTEANNLVYCMITYKLPSGLPEALIEILERGQRTLYRKGLIHGLQHATSLLSPKDVGVLMGGLDCLRVDWGLPLVAEAVGSTQIVRWEAEASLSSDTWKECLERGASLSLEELVEHVIAALKKL